MIYAQIIVRSRTRVEELTYAVPAHIIPYLKPGSIVVVPLRRQKTEGVVVGLSKKVAPELKNKMREIVSIDKKGFGFNESQVAVVRSLADYYASSLGEIASSAFRLPQPLEKSSTVIKPIKPVILQGTWEKRLEFYSALIKKHAGKHRLLFIFSLGAHAQELVQKCGKNALSVDDNLLNRKKVPIFEQNVVIGTLSASFFPLKQGDYLIIDQPEEIGLRAQHRPYMSAKRIALTRANIEGIQLVLGSTTVNIADLPKINNKYWSLFTRPRPKMDQTIFSALRTKEQILPNLVEELSKTLSSGGKALVFTASKGLASALICAECGQVVKCPNCEQTFSVKFGGKLHCSGCGKEQFFPQYCLGCGRSNFRTLGYGSTKIVQNLRELFPDKTIVEVTSDTDNLPNSADIVVATERILSFSNVNFEAVFYVNIDRYLVALDTEDAWRFLNLSLELAAISQKQFVQTFLPEHWVWTALAGNIREFYDNELVSRRSYNLPPFGEEITVIGVAENEKKLLKDSARVAEELKKLSWLSSVTEFSISRKTPKYVFGSLKISSTKLFTSKQKLALRDILPPAWRLLFN